ncbi:HAD-IIB family hydrolase [Spongiactinospora sp. 9N601]|uniref:HAD-IIB family hydrolase n=1 Tax=Spongiactinospora sp. 9N601 TaxID=3375149 RepID=UPI0037B608C5
MTKTWTVLQGSLLVSDLDGTLLRPDTTLGAETVAVINQYVADGGLFTYATARSFTSAAPLTASLKLRLPVVTYGGAIIVDPNTGRARPPQVLTPDVADDVLEWSGRHRRIRPIVFVMHEERDRVCWQADRSTPRVEAFLARRRNDPRLLPICELSSIDRYAVFNIAIVGDYEPLLELRDILAASHDTCYQVLSEDIYAKGDWRLDVMSRTATKAAALSSLRTELNAPALICFGDSHNDLPMFEIADIALAVENAEPEVRAASMGIIGRNSDQGVAGWISRYGQSQRLTR